MRKGREGGEKKNGKNGVEKKEKTDDYSGHYVIASSRPPECRPLERRLLVPKWTQVEAKLGETQTFDTK